LQDQIPNWLSWAQEIQAISQNGLTFLCNEFDAQRYQRLMQIAAEIIAQHTDIKQENLQQNFLEQQGYATPKIDVRGAIIRDQKILLVQERSDQRWCLPGGWVDVGERPSASAEREVFEESGFQVKARKIIGVYDANRNGRPLNLYHAFKIIFLCEIIGGTETTSNETMGVDFFDFHQLPPLSLIRTNERHLNTIYENMLHPSMPTFFD